MMKHISENKIHGLRPLLLARLWLKAASQVARHRVTMIWMFYCTSKNANNF